MRNSDKPKSFFPKEQARSVAHRLKSLNGQLKALITALETGEAPESVHHQFISCEKALKASKNELYEEVYRRILAAKISELKSKCPGDCGQQNTIDAFLTGFPNLSNESLLEKIKETDLLDDEVSKYLKKTEPET
ncbi:MAG: metal-sensing transcriptional repressor [Cyclobacteriaceae bacterium]